MGYDNNKISLIAQGITGTTARLWVYHDTGGEAIATYKGAAYFKDAGKMGCDSGDRILVFDDKSSKMFSGYFTKVMDTGSGTAKFDTGSAAGV